MNLLRYASYVVPKHNCRYNAPHSSSAIPGSNPAGDTAGGTDRKGDRWLRGPWAKPRQRQPGPRARICPPATGGGEQAWEEAGQGRHRTRHSHRRLAHPQPRRRLTRARGRLLRHPCHRPRRKANRITQQLHALGYRVTLEPVAWSDGLVIFES